MAAKFNNGETMLRRKMPPVHPGTILREDVINESGLTVTDAAKMLGVTRTALSDILNGKAAISAEMAFRIEAVFGGTADIWTRLQMKYQNWSRLKLKYTNPEHPAITRVLYSNSNRGSVNPTQYWRKGG